MAMFCPNWTTVSAKDIIDGLDATELAVAVRDLDSDDVVDLLEDLDEPQTRGHPWRIGSCGTGCC